MAKPKSPTSPSRRRVIVGAAAGAALLGAPAIVRSQQPRRFLRPLVAGLNAKEGDPSYESISRIPKILREKYNVQLDIQVHPSSVLGTDIQQIESVQTGFIDIASNVTAQWASFCGEPPILVEAFLGERELRRSDQRRHGNLDPFRARAWT